ncbi:hypothetical protein JCM10450v2_002007 [Rhodotorula kratochvilovae]
MRSADLPLRPQASLSRPVFREDVASPSLDRGRTDGLDALALAGRDGPRSGSNSLALDGARLSVTTSMRVACEVQIEAVRSRPFVRLRKTPSWLAPPARPTPKRSMTRLVPLTADDGAVTAEGKGPFEAEAFVRGLRMAGYLQPIDTSRKTIKGRFSHGLQKEEFKDNLDVFLEMQELKARGEYMVRFKGTAADAHSPYVHLFVTSLPASTSTVKAFPDSTTNADASLTTWTHIPTTAPAVSEWAAKARKFWPVRVQLEGPTAVDVVPVEADAAVADPRSRRRVRRDTFQREVDLDAEVKQREEAQAIELRDNTERNALRASEAAALTLDTSGRSSSRRKKAAASDDAPAQDSEPGPATPTSPSVLDAVKLLGESIAHDPRVQSLTETVTRSASGLREWFASRSLPAPFEAEVGDAEEERERRKKEKRRRKREEQRRAEEMLALEEEEMLREKEARRQRREERRRRRAAEEAEGM